MKKSLQNLFVSSIISSVIFLVIGLLLFIRPESTISLISYIFGGLLVIIGTNSLINYYRGKDYVSTFEIVYGVLSIIGGLILIINPKAIASLIPLILGFWIVISSLIKLKYIDREKSSKSTIVLIITILMLILGIVLIFNPFEGAVFITKMIGLFLIIYSILDIVQSIMIKNDVKKVQKAVKKIKKNTKIIDEE